MRERGSIQSTMIPLRLMITAVLVVSLLINLCLLIRTGSDVRVLRDDDELRTREMKDLIVTALDKSDLFSPTSSRALILDTLLDCILDKLTLVAQAASSSGSNVTDSGDWPLSRALGPGTLKKMNHRLQAELEAQKSVISFLSQPIINEHNFTYIHNPRKVCEVGRPEVLFVIPSATANFQNREKVRESSRGQYVKDAGNSARLLFFLGRPPYDPENPNIQEQINWEVRKYGDIVQEDFEDTYKNIRLKAVSMLKWVSTYCESVKTIIRTDDDVDIDPKGLTAAVKRVSQRYENFILGERREDWEPVRDKNHKNFMSWQEYPHTTLPPFALGGLLGYPVSSVRLLYQAALRIKPIWLDDVFITGICAPKVNVPLLKDDDFVFKHRAWT